MIDLITDDMPGHAVSQAAQLSSDASSVQTSIQRADVTRPEKMTSAIELIYLRLNSFLLEWNYRRTYGEDMGEFYKGLIMQCVIWPQPMTETSRKL